MDFKYEERNFFHYLVKSLKKKKCYKEIIWYYLALAVGSPTQTGALLKNVFFIFFSLVFIDVSEML